jgi:hypothetical protein
MATTSFLLETTLVYIEYCNYHMVLKCVVCVVSGYDEPMSAVDDGGKWKRNFVRTRCAYMLSGKTYTRDRAFGSSAGYGFLRRSATQYIRITSLS